MKDKTIETINDKGFYHGYQRWYWDGNLAYRGIVKNASNWGYSEHHAYDWCIFFIN